MSEPLPQQSSTSQNEISSQQYYGEHEGLIHFLLKKHCCDILGIPQESSKLTPIKAYAGSHVFILKAKAGDIFTVKACPELTIAEVEQIIRHMISLRDLGFNIPLVVAITLFMEKYPVIISRYVDAVPTTAADLGQIAQLMAKLHVDAASLIPSPEKKLKTDSYYKALLNTCESWEKTKYLKKIYDELDISYLTYLPIGTIHGDFSYTKILKSKDGQLVMIDWDHMCTSYFLNDLARSLIDYAFDEEGKVQENTVQNFLKSYNAIRELTSAEKKHFYSHLKLLIIDLTLSMYHNLYIRYQLTDKEVAQIVGKDILSEYLFKQLRSLEDKQSIDLFVP